MNFRRIAERGEGLFQSKKKFVVECRFSIFKAEVLVMSFQKTLPHISPKQAGGGGGF